MDKHESSAHLLDIDPNATTPGSKKHNSKNKSIMVLIAVVAILIGVIGFFSYQHIQAAKREAALEEAYEEATATMEIGNYEMAQKLFEELGDYKDSTIMVQECIDAQVLDILQSTYRAIDTVWKIDNELVGIVSTIIRNVDTLNDTSSLIFILYDTPISYLYNGQGSQWSRSCSLWDASRIKGSISSAQIREGGRYGYDVTIPIHSTETAKAFVNSLESANSLMASTKELITDVGNLSTKYQAIQEQLLLAYDALENYHSFVVKKPADCENYNATAQQKKIAVSDLLAVARKLEPTIDKGK